MAAVNISQLFIPGVGIPYAVQYMNIIIPAEMCNLYALWLSLVIPTAIIQAAYEYTYLVHNFGAPHV